MNDFNKAKLIKSQFQQKEEEANYQSEHGNVSWQQERMLQFGRSSQVRNFFYLVIISALYSIFLSVRAMTMVNSELYITMSTISIIISAIVNGIMIYGFAMIRKGSKNYNPTDAHNGSDILYWMYKISYILSIVALVVGGILLIANMFSMARFGGLAILMILVFFIIYVVVAIVAIVYIRKIVDFFENFSYNLKYRKTRFHTITPDVALIRTMTKVFFVLGIIGFIIYTFTFMNVQTGYSGEELPVDGFALVQLILGLVSYVLIIMMCNKFDAVMRYYRRKIS